MSTSIARVTGYYARHGFGATVARLGLAARRALSGRMALFYFDLSAPGSPSKDLPNHLKIRRCQNQADLSPADLEEITNFWNRKLASRNIQERFDLGASMWLIDIEGKLAGYGCTLQGCTVEPHYFRLGPDDVHLFDFQVFPQYRGRGLNPLLVNYILRSVAFECRGRAFIEAAEWNRAQLASLRRTPFRRFGAARKFTLLGSTVVCWANKIREPQPGHDSNETALAPGGCEGSRIPDLRA